MMARAAARDPAVDTPSRAEISCLVVEDHTPMGQMLMGMLRAFPGIGCVTMATTVAEATQAAADGDSRLR